MIIVTTKLAISKVRWAKWSGNYFAHAYKSHNFRKKKVVQPPEEQSVYRVRQHFRFEKSQSTAFSSANPHHVQQVSQKLRKDLEDAFETCFLMYVERAKLGSFALICLFRGAAFNRFPDWVRSIGILSIWFCDWLSFLWSYPMEIFSAKKYKKHSRLLPDHLPAEGGAALRHAHAWAWESLRFSHSSQLCLPWRSSLKVFRFFVCCSPRAKVEKDASIKSFVAIVCQHLFEGCNGCTWP